MPLGMYFRACRLCSRCFRCAEGLFGSQKNTWMAVAIVNGLRAAILLLRSQAHDLESSCGRLQSFSYCTILNRCCPLTDRHVVYELQVSCRRLCVVPCPGDATRPF